MCVCVCGGGEEHNYTKLATFQSHVCTVGVQWSHLCVSLEVGVSSRPLQYLQHALRKGNPHNDVQLSIVQEHLRGYTNSHHIINAKETVCMY